MSHLHHIVPIHAGGTDDPENLIELSVMEHAEAHRILWETHGRWQDKLAWQGLCGLIDKEDICREISRANALETNRKRKNDYQSKPENRAKISATLTGKVQSPETVAKRNAANTGKKRTPEQKARMSAAAKGKKKSSEHVEKIRQKAIKQWEDSAWGERAYGDRA